METLAQISTSLLQRERDRKDYVHQLYKAIGVPFPCSLVRQYVNHLKLYLVFLQMPTEMTAEEFYQTTDSWYQLEIIQQAMTELKRGFGPEPIPIPTREEVVWKTREIIRLYSSEKKRITEIKRLPGLWTSRRIIRLALDP